VLLTLERYDDSL
jgi:anaphase-promoting complex subunit 3